MYIAGSSWCVAFSGRSALKQVIEWLFQRVTGVVLLFGLIIHFYTMHYSGAGQLSYEMISARISNPYWIGFNIIFLVSAVYHGLNGLLGIILEYVHSHHMQKVCEGLLILVGIVLTGVGIYILSV